MNRDNLYKLEFQDRMSTTQVQEAVDYFTSYLQPWAIMLDRYKLGKNNRLKRIKTTVDEVGECIVIPYGRKIINTVSGYMYKPGNITVSSENEPYKDAIDNLFDINEDDIKTSAMGEIVSTFGVGYEILELRDEVLKYYPMTPKEIMPIFNFDIEPQVSAFIRVYKTDEDYKTRESTFNVDVYYDTTVASYQYKNKTLAQLSFIAENGEDIDEVFHGFDKPPLVVYNNNAEIQGDFEPVISLIDAYDVLMADGFTEVEKFAMAYLVLSDVSIADDDINSIKKRRILEMTENGKAQYLTKNLSPEYIKFIKEWIKEEIHTQAQVPDMSDDRFGGDQSGVAIRYKLSDLENLCSKKEIYFRKGLYDRLDFISWYLSGKGVQGDINEVSVAFVRNFPQNYNEIAEIITKLRGSVSLDTLLSEIVPFVHDSTEEIEKLDKEMGFEPLTE